MKQHVPLILDTISAVALAIWLGGIVVIWAVLAPLGHPAGAEVHPWFVEGLRRFSVVAESCGIIIAAVQWALRRRYEKDRHLFVVDGLRMLVLFAALLCAEYGRYLVIPALAASKTSLGLSTLTILADIQGAALAAVTTITIWLLGRQLPVMAAVVSNRTTPANVPPPQKAAAQPYRKGKR